MVVEEGPCVVVHKAGNRACKFTANLVANFRVPSLWSLSYEDTLSRAEAPLMTICSLQIYRPIEHDLQAQQEPIPETKLRYTHNTVRA
jgi:hypothetical protein